MGPRNGEVGDVYQIDRKKFGAFVAQLRKEKGYTQRELAQQLYLSDKAVSKWETGVSIPDTSLLIPLSELLGVTVTELLLCQRQEPSVEIKTAEQAVKTAIWYAGGQPPRAYQTKSGWMVWFVLALLAGAGGVLANAALGVMEDTLWTVLILSAVFGGYFCFFAPTRLPDLYDQHQIGLVLDGVFRLHVPGLRFHNGNWPHIVTAIRVWACVSLVGIPGLNLAGSLAIPALWERLQSYVLLVLYLGGLFLSVYGVGKRYQ